MMAASRPTFLQIKNQGVTRTRGEAIPTILILVEIESLQDFHLPPTLGVPRYIFQPDTYRIEYFKFKNVKEQSKLKWLLALD